MEIKKAYVLNLNTDNKILKERLDRVDLKNPYQWEIVVAIRGINTDIKWNPYLNWQLKDHPNAFWSRPLLEGEVGCSLGHIKMWQKAYNEGHELCLFLEEDFEITHSLKDLDLSDLPADVDGFYLGRNKVVKNEVEEEVGKNWLKPGYSYNTHAYCLTRRGLEKILKYDFINNIFTPDEFLSATFCTHPREDIAKLFKPTLNFYAHKTQYFRQKNPHSVIDNSKPVSKLHFNKHKYEILDDSDWNAWKDKYLDPVIKNANENAYSLMIDHLGDEVYDFPLFSKRFCDEIITMTEDLDNWTYARHKNYPTTDVLLQDIGMNDIYNRVAEEVIRPMLIHLWKLEGRQWETLRNENFLARYLPDAQAHLALHHDASDISMVVKLNNEFQGGGTWFPKYGLLANPEKVGTASLHPGQITHRHGARPIYSGRRYILVSFIYRGGAKKNK